MQLEALQQTVWGVCIFEYSLDQLLPITSPLKLW